VNDAGAYDVQYDLNALKELGRLDTPVARRIARAVGDLRGDPRSRGGRPLAGHPNLWRMRVGDYRVSYTIRDTELGIIVLRIAHRSSGLPRPLTGSAPLGVPALRQTSRNEHRWGPDPKASATCHR